MSEMEYKPNSHRYKEGKTTEAPEKKEIKKVVSGPVRTKKKSEISKFADVFISEDVANVKSYILMDVLVPAFKKAISDIVTNGIDMILYGESGRRKSSSSASYVSYRNYSDRRDDRNHIDGSSVRARYNYDDVVLTSRPDAEEVLTRMDELIDTYGMVSVADMYDLVGKTCQYTDNNYGWTNLRTAEIVRVRDGYINKLPKALPIK